jgi:hypothetical protein
MKNQGHGHKDPDGNNGECRGAKKAGGYLLLLLFSPSHITLQDRMVPKVS